MFNLNLIVFVSLFCLNGRGLGGPVTERKGMLISDYLQELIIRCPNSFMASEIAKALENCSFKPPDKVESANDKQLLCLLYYDINSQLCQGTFEAGDFAEKYTHEVSVKDFCTESEHWTVSDIPWYSLYQSYFEGLFKDKFSCSSLCHDPSKLHNVNNVCKLYKIGYDLLHETKLMNSTEKLRKEETTKKLDFSESNENERPPVHRDTSPAEILPRKALEEVYAIRNSVANPSTIVENKTETGIKNQTKEPTIEEKIRNRIKLANKPEINELTQPMNTMKTQEVINPGIHQPEVKPPIGVEAEAVDDKEPNIPQNAVEETVVKPNKELEKDVKNTNPVAQPSLEKQKVKQEDIDDWGEPEVKDENELANEDPALTDDDADDTELEDSNKPEQKLAETPKKTIEHFHPSPKLPDSMHTVSFPTQPESPSEDDGFVFYLCMMLVVIFAMIYVLYHRSRVINMVMGVIVEGRQMGRRRNSRGHAYKRLDTLEQAMSSSTTAPPSKIIY